MEVQIKKLQNTINELQVRLEQLKKVNKQKNRQVDENDFQLQMMADEDFQNKLMSIKSPYLEMDFPRKSKISASQQPYADKPVAIVIKRKKTYNFQMVGTLSVIQKCIEQFKLGKYDLICKLVQYKQDILADIDEGVFNAQSYYAQILKINILKVDEENVPDIFLEKLTLKRGNNLELNFKKMIKHFKRTLAEQKLLKTFNIQAQKQYYVYFELDEREKVLVDNFNNAPEHKKKELFAESFSRLVSLNTYYKINFLEKKRKQLENELLPKEKFADQISKNFEIYLLNPDFGKFYLMDLSKKLTFEDFHGTSEKQYLKNLLRITTKTKLLLDIDVEIFNDMRNSHKNFKLTSKFSQRIDRYKSELEYLNQLKTLDKYFTPLPTYKITEENYEFYSENSDLKDNELQIIITKAEGFETAQLRVYFDQQKDPRATYDVVEGPQTINTEIKTNSAHNMTSKSIRIVMKKKVLLFSVELIDRKISLQPLQTRSNFKGTLIHESVRVEYHIKARQAKSVLSKVKVQIIAITRFPEYKHTKIFQQRFVHSILYSKGKTEKKYGKQHKLFYIERTEDIVAKLQNIKIEGLDSKMIIRPELYSHYLQYYYEMGSVLQRASKQYYSYKGNSDIINQLQKQFKSNAQEILNLSEDIESLLELDLLNDNHLLEVYSSYGFKDFEEFIQARIEMTQKQYERVQKEEKNNKFDNPVKAIQEQKIPSKIVNSDTSLFYVSRTEQILQIFDDISSPIEYIEPDDLRLPETICFSKQYYTQFKEVFERAKKSDRTEWDDIPMTEIQDRLEIAGKKIVEMEKNLSETDLNRILNDSILFDYKLRRIYSQLQLYEFQAFVAVRIEIAKKELGNKLFVPPIKQQPGFALNKKRDLFQIEQNYQQTQILKKFPVDIQFPHLPVFCPSVAYLGMMMELTNTPVMKEKYSKGKAELDEKLKNYKYKKGIYKQNLMEAKIKDNLRLEVYRNLDLEDYYYFIVARLQIVDQELSKI